MNSIFEVLQNKNHLLKFLLPSSAWEIPISLNRLFWKI